MNKISIILHDKILIDKLSSKLLSNRLCHICLPNNENGIFCCISENPHYDNYRTNYKVCPYLYLYEDDQESMTVSQNEYISSESLPFVQEGIRKKKIRLQFSRIFS